MVLFVFDNSAKNEIQYFSLSLELRPDGTLGSERVKGIAHSRTVHWNNVRSCIAVLCIVICDSTRLGAIPKRVTAMTEKQWREKARTTGLVWYNVNVCFFRTLKQIRLRMSTQCTIPFCQTEGWKTCRLAVEDTELSNMDTESYWSWHFSLLSTRCISGSY